MGDSLKQIIRIIARQLKNDSLLNHASNAFKETTERAHEKFAYAQNVAAEKYAIIAKQVNGATIIQDLNGARLQSEGPLPKQVIVWWKWYQELTGLDDVEHARRQVIAVQDKLFNCQEKRRKLTHLGTVVNNNLSQTYGELIQTKREDPKYVQLTIIENKSLRESKQINEQLTLLENEEKEYFTQLATAIKEYHDSQTANAMKYKYLSIVASALFAIVSLVGSMIYNNKRIKDVRNVVSQAQKETQNSYITTLGALQQDINNKFGELYKAINTEKKYVSQPNPTVLDFNERSMEDILSNSKVEVAIACFIGINIVLYCLRAIANF